VDDGQQPRREAAAGPVVGTRVAPHAEEDVLQHVLGQSVVAEDAARQRERGPTEPVVEVVDGGAVAGADAADEVGIGDVVLRAPCRSTHGSHRHTGDSDPRR
jgi:hypothetical protein